MASPMAVSLSSACLSTVFLPTSFDGLKKSYRTPPSLRQFNCSCALQPSLPDEEDGTSGSGPMQVLECTNNQLVKAVLATAVTGLVLFSPCGDALAAKSGGRVGGQAFRSAPPPAPRAAPRMEAPRRTNIFVNPPPFVAPPLYGGYGGPSFGGWGWSPFYAPGPSLAVGGGFNIIGFFLLMALVGGIINFFRRGRDDDYYD